MLPIELRNTESSPSHGGVKDTPPPGAPARVADNFAALLGKNALAADDVLPLASPVPARDAAGEELPQAGNDLPSDGGFRGDWMILLQQGIDGAAALAGIDPAVTDADTLTTGPRGGDFSLRASVADPRAANSLNALPETVLRRLEGFVAALPGASDAGRNLPLTAGIADAVRAGQGSPGIALQAGDIGDRALTPLEDGIVTARPLTSRGATATLVSQRATEPTGELSVRSRSDLPLSVPGVESLKVAPATATPMQAVADSLSPIPTPLAGPTAPVGDVMPALPAAPSSAMAAAAQGGTTEVPRIDIALHDSAWGDALSERVVFMNGKNLRSAELRLHPAELGPIRVQLTIDDNGTNVTFSAHHALTRDAIEQAMPRLRELFSEQGLSLGQTSVTDQGVRRDHDGHDRAPPHWQSVDTPGDSADSPATVERRTRAGASLIDTFA